MDPWRCQSNENCGSNELNDKKFEDNFSPAAYDKLPDSDEYLSSLEAKLNKIKSDPRLLKQLVDKRKAYMQQLLNTSESLISDDASLDEPVANLSILRTVMPQKQAMTQGEIVKLVNYDQLLNEDLEQSVENSNH